MTGVVLQTPHLVLRPWTTGDAGTLFDILQEKNILQYFPAPGPPGHEIVGAYIQRQMVHWEGYGYGHWAVTLSGQGQILGWDGLEFLPELGECEVAYLLSRKVWGCGYATEAARAALRFGFETCGLENIIGLVHPENAASIRVLEKCGLSPVDRIHLWGMELRRYRIERAAYEALCAARPRDWQAVEIKSSEERP